MHYIKKAMTVKDITLMVCLKNDFYCLNVTFKLKIVNIISSKHSDLHFPESSLIKMEFVLKCD